MKKIFCYGTLQEEDVQLELVGRSQSGKLACIEGYIVVRDYLDPEDGIEYPRIIEYPKGCVYGRVLEFTDKELALIGRYETEMYRLSRLKTKEGDPVWVYMPV